MTVIEFYDEEPVENIAALLEIKPDKVIFVGKIPNWNKKKKMYENFLEKRWGDKIPVEYKKIEADDSVVTLDVLKKIVSTSKNCIFDLTGGSEIALFSMGRVCEIMPDNIGEVYRYNIPGGTLTIFSRDGKNTVTDKLQLSIDETIRLHGGVIIDTPDRGDSIYKWSRDDSFKRDVDELWKINCKNIAAWNTFFSNINDYYNRKISEIINSNAPHTIGSMTNIFTRNVCEINISSNELSQYHISITQRQRDLLHELQDEGFINNLSFADGVRYNCRDLQIGKLLEKAGNILEVKVQFVLLSMKREEGTPLFGEIMAGVPIDWDGTIHPIPRNCTDIFDTTNEIDEIAMLGAVPVFISCKNGRVDNNELYKFDRVSDQFGGKYVKKILLRTKKNNINNDGELYVMQRARDMKIRIVDNLGKMTDEQIAQAIAEVL